MQPLLLVHSLLTDSTVFEVVRPMLARDHRVTAIDLPGFGATPPRALPAVGDWADHLAAAMDELDLDRSVDVFGNGFGAFVALELAIRHGDRFRRLIVADCVPAFPDAARAPFRGMAARVKESGMEAVLDTAIGRMFPEEFQKRNPEVIAFRKARLARVDPSCFAQACLGLAELDLRPRLSTIRNKSLVMCGALDRTTPPELAREVAAAIPGAEYREIAGCGHCPMLEQPEALAKEIRAFTAAAARAA